MTNKNMKSFQLDSQLQKDCIVLGELEHSLLLLMNNALLPWFILVPKTDKTELYELASDVQAGVWAEVNAVSKFVKNEFAVDKLNVAAIGNVVKQLHIHVIGRKHDDFCWPGVVWGRTEKASYEKVVIDHLMASLDDSLQLKINLADKS
ncbi:MAG: HIT family protein [Gammaproteobacteria bacterium]|nr:HIT family protein [Gammaproteobacteria bacterium]